MVGGQAIAKASGAIGGVSKGLGGTIGGIFKLLFLVKARWTITILLLVFSLFVGVTDSIEQRSFYPALISFGDRMVSSDEGLFWRIKSIEDNDWRIPSSIIDSAGDTGFWKDTKSIFSKVALFFYIISTGWFIYVIVFMFYWLFNKLNDTSWILNVVIALLLVFLLQSMYGVTMFFVNYDCSVDNPDICLNRGEREEQATWSLVPLKGTTSLIVNLWNGNLIDAFTDSASPLIPLPKNESINQTSSLGL